MNFKRLISFSLIFSMVISIFAYLPFTPKVSAAETFKVTLDPNGATGTLSESPLIVNGGSKISKMPSNSTVSSQLKLDGYIFSGQWATDRDGVNLWNANTDIVAKDITLYAIWTKLYTVTFNLGGIELMAGTKSPVINESLYPNQVPHNGTVPISQVQGTNCPKAMSYLFDGWYSDPELTTPFNSSTKITGNITIYAKWKPANNIVFNLNYDTFPLKECIGLCKVMTGCKTPVCGCENPCENECVVPVCGCEGGCEYATCPTPDCKGEERLSDISTIQVLDDVVIPSNQRPADKMTNRTPAGWIFKGWYEIKDVRELPDPDVALWDINTKKVPANSGTVTLYAHYVKSTKVSFDSNWEGATNHPKPQDKKTGDKITSVSNPQQRPNITPCSYYGDGDYCKDNKGCTEKDPAPANRHGSEFSFAGWYLNPECTGEQFITTGNDATIITQSEDFTLYAKWVPSYKVTYVINPNNDSELEGGNISSFVPFKYATIPVPPSTSKPSVSLPNHTAERHIFGKWFSASTCDVGTEFTSSIELKKDITLYAKWTPAYIVTFDFNYDQNAETSSSSQLVKKLVPRGAKWESFESKPPSLSRTGYDFEGWYENKVIDFSRDKAWDENTPFTSDITLYAGWSQKIKVEFIFPECDIFCELDHEECYILYANAPYISNTTYDNGKAIVHRPQDHLITEGKPVVNIVNDTNDNKYMYRFTVVSWCLCEKTNCIDPKCLWNFEDPVKATDENNVMRLYANLAPAATVEYDLAWPGEGVGERYLSSTSALENRIVSQLSFGMTLGSTTDAIPADLTPPKGSVGQAWPGRQVPPNNETTGLPYEFVGWYTSLKAARELDNTKLFAFGPSGTPVNGNITVYAGWRSGLSVSFDQNLPTGIIGEVTVPVTQFLESGTKATNPNPNNIPDRNPKLDGYVFRGWFTDKSCTTQWDFQTPVTENVVLYAKWVETFYIMFDINKGLGQNPPDVLVAKGDLLPNPVDPNRGDDWKFTGWFKSFEGAENSDKSLLWNIETDTANRSLTLYAGWLPLYNVSFDLNYETEDIPPATNRRAEGDYAIRPAPPVREGYSFIGWYTKPDFNPDTDNPWVFDENTVESDLVLYAGWATGAMVNPLLLRLSEITAAAEAGNGDEIVVDMLSGNGEAIIPEIIVKLIKGKNVKLSLMFENFSLLVDGLGTGMTTAEVKDWNLNVNFSTTDKILTTIPEESITEYAKERPVWQLILGREIDTIATSITLFPGEEHSYPGKYGIMIARRGVNFEDRRNSLINNTGNITLNLSLGLNSSKNEFIVLINDEPSSKPIIIGTICEECKKDIEDCICCPVCKKAECICEKCIVCNQRESECVCCPFCKEILCICEICPKCGERMSSCVCPTVIVCPVCSKEVCECTKPCSELGGCLMGEWIITTMANCVTEGERKSECTRTECDLPATVQTITKTAHSFGDNPVCKTTACVNSIYGCSEIYACRQLDCENCSEPNKKCECKNICGGCGYCRDCRKVDGNKIVYSSKCKCGIDDHNACDCYILGDISNTGKPEISDALEILMYLAGMKASILHSDNATPQRLRSAKISNPNGDIVISDALEILMHLAGMDASLIDGTVDGKKPKA